MKRPDAMTENDPLTTRRAAVLDVAETDIVRALAAEGFTAAEEIGRGGFGIVYRCRQDLLDRHVAVKVLRRTPDDVDLERFLREQRAMGRVSGHPHIVTVLQAGTTDVGLPYLVMPYHPHDSLETLIRRHGPLGWPEAFRLGIKVAGALETAHRASVLHRDIKPGNILITEYGEPQLTDFGIARVGDGFRTTAGEVTGSPAFTAPEVLRGKEPTPASDVYGLAATLFAAITGHAAFERRKGEKVVAQFIRITSEPVPDLRGDGIPDDACDALERGMASAPENRPATAVEFGEILRDVQRAHDLPVDGMALPGPPPSVAASGGDVATAGVPVSTTSGRSGPSAAPSTRFRPPSTTRPLVERTRLLSMLREGGRRRLIAVHAPTGFGKSTLAAQWSDVLRAEGISAAWLTVDSDDNNVLWFLTHLVEAMKQVQPALARDLTRVLDAHGDDATRYVLGRLIDELHRSDTAVTLVVDDWHLITSPETVAALDFLLEQGCHHLQLLVTSRSRAGLPLSRMRVRDELVEIDSAVLRFDVDESDSFLRDVGGIDLEPEDVHDLNRTTEGWAAALQLASLSLRDSDDPAWLIENITGRHHAIGEFLADNVLSTLEPSMYEFLLAVSVPDSICGSLAAELTGDVRSQAMLEDAEHRDLFLRHVDEERTWFRFHSMFLEFLRRRLERDHPDRIVSLHLTAARWFARNRMLREAVDHALAGDDTALAVEALAQDGMYLMEHGHIATLLALLDQLPAGAVAADPRLLMTQSWANGALLRLDRSRRGVEAVRTLLDRGVTAGQDERALRMEADAAEAAILMNSDRIEGIDALIAPCLDDPYAVHPWVVAATSAFASYADIFRFEFDTAIRRQEWAEPFHRDTRGPFAAIYGQCLCGIAANEKLEVAEAEKYFRTALRRARRTGGLHTHSGRLAAAMLGELLYEQGRLTEAHSLLDETDLPGIECGATDFMIARFATAARLAAAHGDRTEAAKLLDTGLRAATDLHLPRLRARMENEQVRLGIRTPLSPLRSMPDSDEPLADGTAEVTRQVEDATAIRLLYDSGAPGSAEHAVEWARLWVRRTAGRRARAHLQAVRLLVACLQVAGRTDEAEDALCEAVDICAHRGMVRYLVDGGPHVLDALRSLREKAARGEHPIAGPNLDTEFADAVLALAAADGSP